MSVTSPTRADYPIKGLQQHPVKDALGFDNSKYLKFPYPSSKSGEVHRFLVTVLGMRRSKVQLPNSDDGTASGDTRSIGGQTSQFGSTGFTGPTTSISQSDNS
ncbi:hypothetical protein L3X38_044745 [Prunus dulcis]|uniref:Uncharacterized protein n=1 Tax=Prunus dulcis TaxID=3755 RepID=A0AAD4UZ96_PRUDU|nr:hypothetical protein L3X38_044745 [Prunus dulcis]